MQSDPVEPKPADAQDVAHGLQGDLDRLTILANAGEALSSTLDAREALVRVCRTLVPGLADWCVVDAVQEKGEVRRLVVEHRDPDLVPPGLPGSLLPRVLKGSTSALAGVLRGGAASLLTEFPRPDAGADPLDAAELDLFERLGARSAIVAPLASRGRVLGALTLVRAGEAEPLDQESMGWAEDLAHRIALALDNAGLHAQVQLTAERLQRALLPDLPASGALELAARYQPSRATAEVGGDWYDAFTLPQGATALIIGDVTGHDLHATVTMSQVRNMLRGIACDRKEPPAKILGRLDAAYCILYPGQTVTCIYALVEKLEPDETWKLHYACAGHPPPLLISPDGETRYLEEGRSLLLGVDAERIRPDATVALPDRSTVLLYTDGLIERRGEDLDRGLARLRRHAGALAGEPLDVLCDALLNELGADSTDDVALIAVRTPRAGTGPATATAE